MPEPEDNDDQPEPQAVEILPPQQQEQTLDDVYHAAYTRSQSWRGDPIWGLDDDDCDRVIAAELKLFEHRQLQLADWIAIGEGVEILQRVVINQSGASNHMGRRYNRKWDEIAPDQIRELERQTRADAVWLFLNREPVISWWRDVPLGKRDRWGTPGGIRKAFERDRRVALSFNRDPDAT
jgi:hypothetical protein